LVTIKSISCEVMSLLNLVAYLYGPRVVFRLHTQLASWLIINTNNIGLPKTDRQTDL